MGARLASLGLQQLVLAGAWVTQSPQQLPATLPASQAGAPRPLLPFVVEGGFQTDGAVPGGGGGWGMVSQWAESGSRVHGFGISLEGDRRMRLRVAGYDGLADFSCYSQQRNVDDGFRHSFMAVVTDAGIQLSVDGLFGVSNSGGCSQGGSPGDGCGFGSFDPSADFIFGGGAAGQTFLGTLSGIDVRRALAHEHPRATAADPNALSPSPTPNAAVIGDSNNMLQTVLPPTLIILGIILVALGTAVYCYLKRKHEEPRAVAAGAAAPAALGTAPLVAPAGAKTAPAPSPVAIGAEADLPGKAAPSIRRDEDEPIRTPASWSRSPTMGSSEMAEAGSELRGSIQALMDATWRDVITRDRARGGSTYLRHFEVVQVLRNENTKLWHEYVRSQRAITRGMAPEDARIATLTQRAAGLDALHAECNEFYLFHGSKPSSVRDICMNDFLLKLAGAHRGTLYGPGVYFAESSSKADEYAEDDKDGIYRGLYAMLLCRVTLGRLLVTEEVRPDGKKLEAACRGPEATHHSVLGDREKVRGTYREFVIFDTKQSYPEFIIIYRRNVP